MSSTFSAAELQAILELVHSPVPRGEVAARDFGEPRRLSTTQLERLQRNGAKALPEIEAQLSNWMRGAHEVELATVVETHAQRLVESWSDPLCALAFECAGQPCWALWDGGAAVAAVEVALGGEALADPKPRELTSVEARVLESMLVKIATACAKALGTRIDNPRLIQEHALCARWQDAPNADPQRIGVQLAINGSTGTTHLRVYLAGIAIEGAHAANARDAKHKTTLPAHLNAIAVEVSATLGSADVPLDQLLALEVGDVITLDTLVGASLRMHVADETCARAKLGEHRGRYALRIESMERAAETPPAPPPAKNEKPR